MKSEVCFCLLIMIISTLSGCANRNSTTALPSTFTETSVQSTIAINTPPGMGATATISLANGSPSYTPTPISTQTVTPVLTPTLEPGEAEEVIRRLLRETVDCPAPCFWGIYPGETTLVEAQNIFAHFGLRLDYVNTLSKKDFFGTSYKFDNGLDLLVTLMVQNDIVKNISLDIHLEKYQAGIPLEWLAYSPGMLIERYGPPSKVTFFVGRVAPVQMFSMEMYFLDKDLIIQYGGYNDGPAYELLRICPVTGDFDSISVWLGKNPENPPPPGLVRLEKATSMTLQEFSDLMTGDPENSCFDLINDAFP